MNEVRTVTIRFEQPFTVAVNGDETLTESQILSSAKEEVIKTLKKKFPPITYMITCGDSLSLEEAIPGTPIRDKQSGELGIIISINPKKKLPIDYILINGQSMVGLPASLEKIHKRHKLDKFVAEREAWRKDVGYTKGDTAFIPTKEGVIPVVFNKVTKSSYHVFPITHEPNGTYFKLTNDQLAMVFPTRKEAEAFQNR